MAVGLYDPTRGRFLEADPCPAWSLNGGAPFAAYVVVVLATSVTVVAAPLVRHGLSDGLIPATVGLIPATVGLLFAGTYLRALVRSVRMRRAGVVRPATSLR